VPFSPSADECSQGAAFCRETGFRRMVTCYNVTGVLGSSTERRSTFRSCVKTVDMRVIYFEVRGGAARS
jgi:hypothetical protein